MCALNRGKIFGRQNVLGTHALIKSAVTLHFFKFRIISIKK